MTAEEFKQALIDIGEIVGAVAVQNPELALAPALDLLKQVVEALPPLDAKDLRPTDRAEVDAEIQAEEDIEFPK